MTHQRILLGLESSCDDTAAAIVRGEPGGPAEILSSVVFGQNALHAAYGGVVPEIAARAHAEKIDLCVAEALSNAQMSLDQVDAIGVTAGPGLIGGLMAGVMCAKGLAIAADRPLYGVNHLAGHALTPRLTDQVSYPFLMLLVSGGHCQFLLVRSPVDFTRLGGTIDDAPDEAFDKVARLIGLPQPGGPNVERTALQGDPKRFRLPRPLLDRPDCNMSFSGLKTAVRLHVESLSDISAPVAAAVAASAQQAIVDALVHKTVACAVKNGIEHVYLAGGVAANAVLRGQLERHCRDSGVKYHPPILPYCTDNGAMVACAASRHLAGGHNEVLALDVFARGIVPSWT